ncbi:MAG: hypothetical protein JWS10_86 [Cypionkella sp.]|uniref:bifunctional DNA primase/polymerase n=1 Tax=Cypionkella sp. TaxID=2811411 RepID=UPI00262C71BB|nr:bifunctional DNA primase/polymerase [Cypionkella sp.]MDB5657471.1 hypothetical protein [Cypionkella sp.]
MTNLKPNQFDNAAPLDAIAQQADALDAVKAPQSAPEAVQSAPRRAPHDRLPEPPTGKRPPILSPYHTARAKLIRDTIESTFPAEVANARAALIAAGLQRGNIDCADVADHNVLTLAMATLYAEHGLKVIDSHALAPLTGRGTGKGHSAKLPRGTKWQERATADAAAIVAFWTGAGKYAANKAGKAYKFANVHQPRNVSIVFLPGCGLFVLDIDGPHGKAALAALVAEHGELPKTVKSITGSGGEHHIFRGIQPIRNTASAIASGVDIRGEGGQIIAAPSIHHSGNFYQWAEGCAPGECAIAQAPAWLEQLALNASKITGKETETKATKTKSNRTKSTAPRDIAVGGFENLVGLIGDGEGLEGFDKPIYRAACSWWATNPDGDALDLIHILHDAISDAPCDDERAEDRYATDDYLPGRVQQAREYIRTDKVDKTAQAETEEAFQAIVQAELQAELESRVKAFSPETPIADLESVIEDATQGDFVLEEIALAKVKKALAKATGVGLRELNVVTTKSQEKAKENRKANAKATDSAESGIIVSETDFDIICEYGQRSLLAKNLTDPNIFCYMEDLYSLEVLPGRTPRMKPLYQLGFANRLNKAARFVKRVGDDGNTIAISAPDDVVSFLYQEPKSLYPGLKGQAVVPYFNASGSLVTQNGYDPEGQIYLTMPAGLDIPAVSLEPTQTEIEKARALLVDDVFGDFPLGGETRKTLMAKAYTAEGVPALANMICCTIQPFLRSMITGDTPIYLVNKPASGTGAGFMIAAATSISEGRSATPWAMSPKDEEFAKQLTAYLRQMTGTNFFDNVDHYVKSPELCAMVTGNQKYEARLLGTGATVEVDILGRHVIAANTFTGSPDIQRRSVMADLDAMHPEPGERVIKWKHDDIRTWVLDNRGELIWACLTLIQAWIAKGKPMGTDNILAGFESWSYVMGGVLKVAGIGGFNANRDKLKATTTGAAQTNEAALVRAIYNLGDNPILRVGGTAKYKKMTVHAVKDILNKADGNEPLLLAGWGYEDGIYTNAQRITPAWDKFASRVHGLTVEDGAEGSEITRKVLISFTKKDDTSNGGFVYFVSIKDDVAAV